MLGNTIERVMTPEGWQIHRKMYDAAMADPARMRELQRQTQVVECEIVERDGRKRDVRVTVRTVQPAGLDEVYVVANIDRADRVQDLTQTAHAAR
jgi:hypothetical protein